ncbi:MAG: hypothetical protein IJ484_08070 [Oscillospiraceae bacterium]|nr:hypothetical protein [Oscillospiraceae bacterium]
MLRCAELGLHGEDLAQMSIGMVYDLLVERANDHEKYAVRMEPGGMRAFFAGGGTIG